jgi:hypothetical protein
MNATLRLIGPVFKSVAILIACILLVQAIFPTPALAAKSSGGAIQSESVKSEPRFGGHTNHAQTIGREDQKLRNAAYDIVSCPMSGDLTIASGETCSLAAGTYNFNIIDIQSGGTLLILGDANANQGVTLNAVNISVAGKIDATGTGYAPSGFNGTGPGAEQNSPDSLFQRGGARGMVV